MKKLIALLLIVVMSFSFSACSSGEDTSTSEEPEAAEQEEVAEEVPEQGEESSDFYFSLIAKGYQHQYWATVAEGAAAAAEDLGVEIYFDGPPSETDIDVQVNMFKQELAKNPDAIAVAPLSADSLAESLETCAAEGIPVICFDSGIPDDTSGAVRGTASTNNVSAAAIAAEKFGEQEELITKLTNATAEEPVVIGCLAQDAVSSSQIERTKGFVEKMAEIAEEYQPGKVSIEGHDVYANPVDGAAVIIRVEVGATTSATDLQTAANALLNMNGISAIFCVNEGAVTGFLAAVSDGEDLAEGGKYEDLLVAGFDAGAAQKNAVRQGWFLGSVTQDPYTIGYKAVEMCYSAANGEEVEDIDTGAKWYDASNIDDEDIAMLVYD